LGEKWGGGSFRCRGGVSLAIFHIDVPKGGPKKKGGDPKIFWTKKSLKEGLRKGKLEFRF